MGGLVGETGLVGKSGRELYWMKRWSYGLLGLNLHIYPFNRHQLGDFSLGW